jgi:hypothetical protein
MQKEFPFTWFLRDITNPAVPMVCAQMSHAQITQPEEPPPTVRVVPTSVTSGAPKLITGFGKFLSGR